MNGEICYLGILARVLTQGTKKSNRTGVDTLVIPPTFWAHDMSEGFPLLTTKKMAKRSVMVELEGFIGGITSKKWYQDRGCKVWDEWCNPKVAPYNTPESIAADDLGPIYGYQWRRFNMPYEDGKPRLIEFPPMGKEEGDQLAHLVHTLKTNPNDRRMKVEGWNFLQTSQQALPACHTGFTITHIDGKLNLHFNMRSVDMFLGAPFNIASYSMLLLLLCKETGFEPGQVSATFVDCHIYENHIDQVKEQLSREPYHLPGIGLSEWKDIWSWSHIHVQWQNYQCHGSLKAPVAV